jgi:hypothetical protein
VNANRLYYATSKSTLFFTNFIQGKALCIAMENARKRVNRVIRTFFQYNCAYVVTHPDLEDCHTSLFKDGVHLSFLGKDIFINIIQGALEQFLFT